MSEYAFGTYPPSHATNAVAPAAAASLEEAVARAQAAQRDAARYRYLRDYCVARFLRFKSGHFNLEFDIIGHLALSASGHDVDAAVDAAMDGRP